MDKEKVLREIVARAIPVLANIPISKLESNVDSEKWSHKQILGHLIDSAINNHRRFVIAQHQNHLRFDGYDQVLWVECNGYDKRDWYGLIDIWAHLNHNLSETIKRIPKEVMNRSSFDHNLNSIAFKTVPKSNSTSLCYLINDYLDHMEHHLNQLISGYKKINDSTKMS